MHFTEVTLGPSRCKSCSRRRAGGRREARGSRESRGGCGGGLTRDVQVQVVLLLQAVQLLRRGAATLLHAGRGGRAAARAGGRGSPSRAPLALALHGGGRGPSGDRDHGPAARPRVLELRLPPPAPRGPHSADRRLGQSARALGRCCLGVRALRAAAPGDPQEGCSVELHSQKRRAHNPPRGPPARAVHWPARRDVTQPGPSYRQVPGDAIKKSLSASANRAESMLATPGWDAPNFCLPCPGATPQPPVLRVSPQVPAQPCPSDSTSGLWDGIFFLF